MFTKNTYVGTLDGVHGMWCGFKPECAEVSEIRLVLYPELDYELRNISTGERFTAVWLKDGDNENNYEEVTPEEPQVEDIIE